MGGVTCPNCGKDNPDFLDNCQFCQAVLRSESTLNIGENPTKKVTGDLEPILPDWLREARQQGRVSAEEDAKKESTKPRVQAEAPPDLLAGLAFQSASDEDEVPDWLAAMNPVEKKTPAPSKPVEAEPPDFFAQFNQPVKESATPTLGGDTTPDDKQKDKLSGSLPQASGQPGEPFRFDSGASQGDNAWMDDLRAPASQEPTAWTEPAKPTEPEDLGWLHDLESSTKQQPATPPADTGWMSNLDSPSAQSSTSQDDLSWLNNLGGTPAPSFDAPAQPASSQNDLSWLNNLGDTTAPSFEAPVQPASSQNDLSWLNNLGDTTAPSFDASTPAQPVSSQEDLDWLSNLGGTPAPSFDAPAQPASSQEDLDWLSNLGGTPAPSFDAPAQPASSQEDLDWLSNLGGTPAPAFDASTPAPFAQPENADWLKNIDSQQDTSPPPSMFLLTPRQTAPLSEEAAKSMPDWLKSATEGASMPPLGATSMDWSASKKKPADDVPLRFENVQSEPLDQTQGTPASVDQNAFASASDSSSLSNQDIDSLFAVEMPDWFSQPDSTTGVSSMQASLPAGQTDSLAPVNLPSWVQAMRPVESAIGEASAVSPDQTTEKAGPLAGLRGVIPFAAIGSIQKPKAISLKLQATDEQQTSAALLERILASETTAHPLKTTPFVVSQRVLRWVLTALFLIVLGAMIGLGSRSMPIFVSNAQMAEISNMSKTIQNIPEGSSLLVVIDYEPALAGEMEAAAGPLLDQIVVARNPSLTFISTSPNGSALVERLMTSTKLSQPEPAGRGYQLGSQYFNVGYLPGGSAGVRGFVEQPKVAMPLVNVNLFSDFGAVIVMTDHAESGLVWIEQLEAMRQNNPAPASQPLLVVASAQAGPLLQPYVSSKQVNGMISGLSDAVRYEFMNNSPGIARSYWDAFGVGLFMAIVAIVLGSLWSLFAGIRARRVEAEQG